jgi:DNA-binding NtrC family response regulator
MSETRRHLVVLDERGALPQEFLGRLDRIGSVRVSRTVQEARERIEEGACRAVLIAVSDPPLVAMSLAYFVREMNPGLPVMVLGGGFEEEVIHLAVRDGLHLIVNDGDVAALELSVTEHLDPASVPP